MRILLFIALLCSSSLLQAQSCRSLQSLEWMLGNWSAVDGALLLSENWEKVSRDSFEGDYQEMDASSGEPEADESMRLVLMSGSVFYIAKVSQNEFPVPFKATSCSGSGAVFENPDHDFPTRIEYELVSESEMRTTVSDGAEDGFVINFSRNN